MTRLRSLIPVLLTFGCLTAPMARADDRPKPQIKKRKVIRLDALTIEGRIQKPQAFYILQRSALSFDPLNKSESFLPNVVKSVDNPVF